MKKLLLALSLGATLHLSAAQKDAEKTKGDVSAVSHQSKYAKPNRSSTNSCGKFSGNLQTLSVGNFNVSVCANDYKFDRAAVLAELQDAIQKELEQAPKAV